MEQFSLIFAERLEWKLLKNVELFSDRVACNSRARKTRNLGALFEVIGNAIGSLLFPKLSQSSLSTCVNGRSKLHQATVLVARMFV